MRFFQGVAVLAVVAGVSLSYANGPSLEEPQAPSDPTTASIFKVDESTHYENNFALRDARKIGLGLAAGGALGLYGLNIEINFEDINGAVVGVGGGRGYSTVSMAWKHVFLGDTIAPYTTLGFAHWYNSGQEKYRDSEIIDRVLTKKEKTSGKFSADFITGALGLQYTHLNGRWAGTSLYAEVVLLGETESATLVPTGLVGAGYYF